ncbi:MAG: LPS export ABC transporter permease LptF [Lautropia sp.]|nr:LPS export ABC transporter permease LptF [Lautropia sp.]
MIFRQSLRRDLNSVAGVMFATLFTILVTSSLIRFLNRATSDRIASSDIVPMIAFSAIGFIPVLLVLTVFLSVLMVLARSWRDSEMVIWFASGQSLTAWVRPVMGFVLPYAVVVGAVALVISPWANQQIADLRERFSQREDVSMVAPGQFRESTSSNRVFFVESLSPDREKVSNVFVVQRDGDRLLVVSSKGGRVRTEKNGDRFLVLEDGRRYDGNWGGAEYSLMEFERYGVRLDPKPTNVQAESIRGMSTLDLIEAGTPETRGELAYRIGLPISVFVIALLAIPLSYVNPRLGRSVNIIIGVLIYFTYSNLNSVLRSWISQERLSFGVGVWITHALVLGLAIYMFHRRMSVPKFSLGKLVAWLRGRRGGTTEVVPATDGQDAALQADLLALRREASSRRRQAARKSSDGGAG